MWQLRTLLCPTHQSLITRSQQTAFQHHLYPHPLSNTLAYILYIAKGSAPSQTRFQKVCRLIHMSEFIGVYKKQLLSFFCASELQQENHSPENIFKWRDQVNSGKVTESSRLGGLSEHARGGVDEGCNRSWDPSQETSSSWPVWGLWWKAVKWIGWKLWAVTKYNILDLNFNLQDLFHMPWSLRHSEFHWFHSDSNGTVKL